MAPVDLELMMETIVATKRLLELMWPRLDTLELILPRLDTLEDGVGALKEWAWCGGCRVSEVEEGVADDIPGNLPPEALTPVNVHVETGDSVPVDNIKAEMDQCKTEEVTVEDEGPQGIDGWDPDLEAGEDGPLKNISEIAAFSVEIQSHSDAEVASLGNTGGEAASTSGDVFLEDSPGLSTLNEGETQQEAEHWNRQNIEGAASEVSSGSDPDGDESMPSAAADPSSEPSSGPSGSVTRNKRASANKVKVPVYEDKEYSEQSLSDLSDSGDEYIPPHSSHDKTCAALKRKRKKRKVKDICKMQSDETNTSTTTGDFHRDGGSSDDLCVGLKQKPIREKTANKKKSGSVHTQVKKKLTGHERPRSDGGPYPCSDCDKRYTTKKGLQMHNKYAHLGVMPYSCDMCDKKFPWKSHMDIHRRTHRGEKPYQCEYCEKCFSSSSHYHCHVRIHKGLKPFLCTVWGKRFGQSGTLHRHMLIHSGEKPFECSTCGKRFSGSGDLRRHMLIHSGEKPFECSTCGKRFVQSGQLCRHMLIHSGEKPVGNSSTQK